MDDHFNSLSNIFSVQNFHFIVNSIKMSLNQETIYLTFSVILTLKVKTIRVSIIHYMGAQRFQGFLIVMAASLNIPKT